MQRLFLYVISFINAHLVRQMEFLRVQSEVLRSCRRQAGACPPKAGQGKQVRTRPEERRWLLKFGLPLGESIKDLICIVSYQTFRRDLTRLGGLLKHYYRSAA